MKDVGIVMPVFKQDPNYLELAIKSILKQSYQNFHFVIVSDGAPSETIEVIKDLIDGDSRVNFVRKELNEGVAKTLNVGFSILMNIKEVKYFTWVSSDNIYYHTFIQKLRDALENAQPEVGLSYSSFRHIDQNGHFLKEPQLEEFYQYQNQKKEKLLDFCFIGTSFMYKKQIASKISGYRLEPVEDYDYWLRLTEYCEIIYIPEVLMEYRTNSPLSISAQLKNSIQQHRRWRYSFNLSRQEARNRRGIPFNLTVIYPIEQYSENIIEAVEILYEQTYSNFKVIVIDQTIDKSAINVLKHIEDPRVKFLELPLSTEKKALKHGMREADTPFTLIYGESPFSTQFTLGNLISLHENFNSKGENQSISTSEDGYGGVVYRSNLQDHHYNFSEVYYTNRLRDLLS